MRKPSKMVLNIWSGVTRLISFLVYFNLSSWRIIALISDETMLYRAEYNVVFTMQFSSTSVAIVGKIRIALPYSPN